MSLITTITDNLHTIANMHIPPPPPLSSANPPSAGLTDLVAEQRVGNPQHAQPSAPADFIIAQDPNRTLTAPPVRSTVPLPPTLYVPPVADKALNLDDAGQPLTCASAKSGRNASQWQNAIAYYALKPIDQCLSPTNPSSADATLPTTTLRPRKRKQPLTNVHFAS